MWAHATCLHPALWVTGARMWAHATCLHPALWVTIARMWAHDAGGALEPPRPRHSPFVTYFCLSLVNTELCRFPCKSSASRQEWPCAHRARAMVAAGGRHAQEQVPDTPIMSGGHCTAIHAARTRGRVPCAALDSLCPPAAMAAQHRHPRRSSKSDRWSRAAAPRCRC